MCFKRWSASEAERPFEWGGNQVHYSVDIDRALLVPPQVNASCSTGPKTEPRLERYLIHDGIMTAR